MASPGTPSALLVLGLGNVLCSDDGLGVAAVEILRRRYRMPKDARVLDGGTLGLSLLSYIDASEDVILVDAVLGPGPAGSLVRLEGDEVAPAVRTRLSCHQIGVADLLDALSMLGAEPRSLVLLGLIPETLTLGLGRSRAVQASVPALVDKIVEEARRLGHEFLPRPRAVAPATPDHQTRAVQALGL
jgi:hydrogenase maturation protease